MRFCVRRGITADAVSYSSIVVSAVAGLLFWWSGLLPVLLLPAVALALFRLWLNMLDGMVALAARTASRRGELLNDLPDRVSDVLIFVGVAHSGLCHPYLGYWVAILALLVAYSGCLAQALGLGRDYGGWMSKPWRIAALSAGALVTFACSGSEGGAIVFGAWTILDLTLFVILVGCVHTIAGRVRRTLRALDGARRT
jgi:phosphatidylglycerophosphate synthase